MQELLTYIQEQAKWAGGILGLSVRSAKTGEIYTSQHGDIRLQPASNMKLLTAIAALRVLGSDYQFSTEIKLEGRQVGNTWEGNVYIVGKGDPTLQVSDYQKFASILQDLGITTITGDIIGDDTWYDDIRLSEDLIWTDEQYYYGAEISALTISPDSDYDTGSVRITVIPSELGDRPSYEVYPNTTYVTIENQAVTVAQAEVDDLSIMREHGGNQIYIGGEIGVNDDVRKEWMSVWRVSSFAIDVFTQTLKEKGVALQGKTSIGKRAPVNAKCIYRQRSPKLGEILIPFMKLSNNGIGEMLVREMGRFLYHEGTWGSGLEIVRQQMRAYGLDIDTIQIKDGSGISHSNLIPANEISYLLYRVQSEEWFPILLNTLPIAGEAERMIGGTLQERMNGLSVKAKTGTIEGVSTLSGYLETERKGTVIFSIMLNNLIDGEIGKEIEDEMVAYISKISW